MELGEMFGEPVSVYTRQQAIEDGVLVDVSTLAQEAGFRLPVAISAGVNALVEPTEREAREYLQDRTGRLWDVLWMARLFASRNREGSAFFFPVIFWLAGRPEYGRAKQKQLRLKCCIGPGDEGEPVITVMLPEED